jgi:hypothetical protein
LSSSEQPLASPLFQALDSCNKQLRLCRGAWGRSDRKRPNPKFIFRVRQKKFKPTRKVLEFFFWLLLVCLSALPVLVCLSCCWLLICPPAAHVSCLSCCSRLTAHASRLSYCLLLMFIQQSTPCCSRLAYVLPYSSHIRLRVPCTYYSHVYLPRMDGTALYVSRMDDAAAVYLIILTCLSILA